MTYQTVTQLDDRGPLCPDLAGNEETLVLEAMDLLRLYRVLSEKLEFGRMKKIVDPLRAILNTTEGDSEDAETVEELMPERKMGLLQISGPPPKPLKVYATTTVEVRFQGQALKEATERELIRLITNFFPKVGKIELGMYEEDFVMVFDDQKHARAVAELLHGMALQLHIGTDEILQSEMRAFMVSNEPHVSSETDEEPGAKAPRIEEKEEEPGGHYVPKQPITKGRGPLGAAYSGAREVYDGDCMAVPP
jgi:hypothetical protein